MKEQLMRRPADRRYDSVARMEEKKRRRQRQRRIRRILLFVAACLLCICSFFAGRLTAAKASETGDGVLGNRMIVGNRVVRAMNEETEVTSQNGTDSSGAGSGTSALEAEAAGKTSQWMCSYVESHPEIYPESLRTFLEDNPEAAEFVFLYPEYHGTKQEIDLSGEVRKGEIPLLLQWDGRWGYREYGDDFLAMSGCGPTCLSMVYVGLTGDTSMDPAAMAAFSMENGYYLEDVGTSWDLMSVGAEKLGLSWNLVNLSKTEIFRALDDGRVLICSMRPGDFTKTGHFIVICGHDGDQLQIRDPNSRIRSDQTWSYETIQSQIKNIWAYE